MNLHPARLFTWVLVASAALVGCQPEPAHSPQPPWPGAWDNQPPATASAPPPNGPWALPPSTPPPEPPPQPPSILGSAVTGVGILIGQLPIFRAPLVATSGAGEGRAAPAPE